MATLPAFEYDSGGGPVTIEMGINLFRTDKFENRGKLNEAFSGSGVRQRQLDFVEDRIRFEFRFVEESVRDALETMMKTWAIGGGEFKYIPDFAGFPGTFTVMELVDKKFVGNRRTNNALNLWTIRFTARVKIT